MAILVINVQLSKINLVYISDVEILLHCYNFQIEGNFKLNVPPMLLGYNTQTQSSDEYGVFPSVYLLISLEPTLNQSPLLKRKVCMHINKHKLICTTNNWWLKHALTWLCKYVAICM